LAGTYNAITVQRGAQRQARETKTRVSQKRPPMDLVAAWGLAVHHVNSYQACCNRPTHKSFAAMASLNGYEIMMAEDGTDQVFQRAQTGVGRWCHLTLCCVCFQMGRIGFPE